MLGSLGKVLLTVARWVLGKMGPWHAVLEVLVLLDLQHVGLPFWHITKPTRYKENPNLVGILTPWSVNVRRNLNP